MTDTTPAKRARPLSPHLQIYKPQITSVLSILHRITGCGLAFGLVVMVAWLSSLARGPEAYTSFANCAHSWVGQILLFGITFSFFFHLCNGVRHLFWDFGLFLELKEVYKTGRITIAAAVILTLIVWLDISGVPL